MTDATHEGAEELNPPSPTSIDSAAQKLNGLFGEEEEREEDVQEESSEEETQEVEESPEEQEEEGEEESPGDDEAEEPEDDEPQPLTSLQDLANRLDVDESSLYDIKLPTKIDGEEGEATLAQLIKSYQLEGSINRKSMELSDSRKELEKQQAKFQEERQKKLQEVEHAANVANQLLYAEWNQVDWNDLRANDPDTYYRKKAEFEEYQQALGQISQATQAERQKAYEEAQKKLEQFIESEQKKLIEAIPEWSNKDTLKKEYSDLINFLRQDFNIQDEELNRMLDHRLYLMARDAKRYRDLQKNPPKDKKDRTPVKTAKAGKRGDHKKSLETNNLRKQFSKRKDVNSAAALISAMAKKQ